VSRSRSDDDDRSLVERATHDLLNPVSSLLGFGETLRTRGASLGDDTIRSFGESIARQAARLQHSIRDLSLASRLLRERQAVEIADVPVAELVAVTERVTVDVPDGLRVRADRDALAEAIGRLVANALAFSDTGVTLRAGAGWIEVADGGTGFAPEGLASAFEPLSAGTNARNERADGVGLGLFIARKLVEAQGGTLTATSAPGEGSVFRIDLPG
jgi:two-component system, OmpR family, sensor histidine kinase BaeS